MRPDLSRVSGARDATKPGLSALPIDELLPEIATHLTQGSSIVLEASPGAGKTTRIPPLVLSLVQGEVLVLEPRRIAARLAAQRAAAEMGESVGQTVGYSVRFESAGGRDTRLRFLTEGVLTRRFLSDPDLKGVDAVILDEFHERHLETDLALALLKRLQQRRPKLKLVVMSATLEAAPVAAFLNDCPVLRSSGRQFPLNVMYQPSSSLQLEQQTGAAIDLLLRTAPIGNTLVFLPGAAEIRRAMRWCEGISWANDISFLPLYGDLSPEEQDRALAKSSKRKVIFATNIAESSVTLEGITAVVDSGLARTASYSPWSGLPTLQVGRVSKASADQRAGRAGRTGPGVVIRLYSQEDFRQRPEHELPAILRSDMSGVALSLRAMGIRDLRSLPWLDVPPANAVHQAEQLLMQLGVNDSNCQEMARLPVPPRISRLLLEAKSLKVTESGIQVAALLGAGVRSDMTDLLELVDEQQGASPERQKRQLRAVLRASSQDHQEDESTLKAVLMGFPDRVAQVRTGRRLMLSSGLSLELLGTPPPYELMTVIEAEVRSDQPAPVARVVARVEPDWLFDCFPDQVRSEDFLEWNEGAQKVEAVSALRFGALTLQESRSSRPDPQAAASLLAEKALEAGLERFVDSRGLEQLLARLHFSDLPTPDLPAKVLSLCIGLQSFSELRTAAMHLLPTLEAEAGPKLQSLAPATLRVSGGRVLKIHYKIGQPPWIASRLQDFFGLNETPRLGPAKTRVVAHLLAPNQRAVQTTADLAGFWDRLYPEVRRELMRRYPRHWWPENPRQVHAAAPPRR